jgi:hypothetical protein
VSAPPLVPVSRALRLTLTAATASRSLLAAASAWLLVLAAVYASDAGPPLPAMMVTAAALLPIAAWAGAASLAATSEDLRAVLTAADGRPRVLLVDGLGPLLFVVVAGVLGVLAALLFDPHPAPTRSWLLGGLLHLLCGLGGVALALLLHALRLARGTQAVVVIVASVVSGRVRWLPPDGPVLSGWGAGHDPSTAFAAWGLGGPVLVAALLLVAAAVVRRRRG